MSDEFVPYLKGDLDARQHRIYNLPDPVDNNEVATKGYVDAGGGSQAVKTATVVVTSAQILALDSVPVTLVAGVTGKVLIPLVLSYSTDGGTPYTSGGNNRLQVGSNAAGVASLPSFGTVITDPDNSSAGSDLTGTNTAGFAGNALIGGDVQMAANDPNTDGDFDVTVIVLYQEVVIP